MDNIKHIKNSFILNAYSFLETFRISRLEGNLFVMYRELQKVTCPVSDLEVIKVVIKLLKVK